MKISRDWLQNFFDKPLPEAQALAEAITFHAFEIESVDPSTLLGVKGDWVLDVKVTPNRGHDALSHRAIAKELSATLNLPLNTERDPFARKPDLSKETDTVTITIEDPKLCRRYIAGYIKGIKVGPSPAWLKEALEAVGQKSINNVVDATNLVMFNTGQPLHAFDAGQLSQKGEKYSIGVRLAKKGEKMLALDDKEYSLTNSMLAIVNGNSDKVIGIAGVKGGKPAGVTETTKDIIIESANFDGVSVRRTATALKLRTDASDRFQQVLSPELAAYGMQQAVDLISAIAGGELVGFADEYPSPARTTPVSVSTAFINRVLGTKFSDAEVEDVFKRLGFSFKKQGSEYVVQPPFERLDIVIPEDLAEEVGRIIGYDKVPAAELPSFPKKPEINLNFYAAEKIREELISKGYSEVLTSVFAEEGERAVANKVGGEKPYLRTTLIDGLKEAHERNTRNKDLLGLKEVKLFEIGTVWKGSEELIMVGTADSKGIDESLLKEASASAYDGLQTSATERYEPFSKYPFIVRDIAMWVPANTKPEKVLEVIRAEAGELLVHSDVFDTFEKDGKTSYAYRLVLQSFEKTLTDEEANKVMEKVYAAVKKQGWEVR